MKLSIATVLFACAAYEAVGDCANACSGHGNCGQFDECTCFHGFAGTDCSLRLCPHSTSWVTTPKGDLNYDGEITFAATYESTTRFTKHYGAIASEANPGGDWERFPSYASAQEGHFEMECSNRGLCDRQTGECQCHSGFTGHACQRTTCFNDCSGHGICISIAEHLKVNEGKAIDGSVATYSLWDADMFHSCKCDPGYGGIDCSERACPLGDDPLTTKYQIDETQYVRVYLDHITGPSAIDWNGGAATKVLGGSFTLEYQSLQGQRFETADISVSRFTPSEETNQVMAKAVKAALEALPNAILPEVTVVSRSCGKVEAGAYAAPADATGAANDVYFRCPGFATSTDVLYASNTGAKANPYGTATAATFPAGGEEIGCEVIEYPECIEFQISFSHSTTSGDLNDLKVDVSKVTYNGFTNEQADAVIAKSSVTDVRLSTTNVDARLTVADIAANKATDVITGVTTASGISTIGLTNPGATYVFPAGSKVAITCASIYPIGTFNVKTTVTATSGNTWNLVLTEVLYDPKGRCATGAAITIQLLTSFVTVDADLQYVVSNGQHGLYVDGDVNDINVASTVATQVAFDGTDMYLLLSETPKGATANVACGNTCTLSLSGKGTKEADVCSQRGICDKDTGRCDCFKGYQGAACQRQDALNA